MSALNAVKEQNKPKTVATTVANTAAGIAEQERANAKNSETRQRTLRDVAREMDLAKQRAARAKVKLQAQEAKQKELKEKYTETQNEFHNQSKLLGDLAKELQTMHDQFMGVSI